MDGNLYALNQYEGELQEFQEYVDEAEAMFHEDVKRFLEILKDFHDPEDVDKMDYEALITSYAQLVKDGAL